MYLFTRRTRLAPGKFREGVEWAVEITDKVNAITSLNVGLWRTLLSPGTGTLSWGCAVETLTDLEVADVKMSVDEIFMQAVNRGTDLTDGSIEDETAQFIVNAVNPSRDPRYVAVVRSQLANGSFAKGIEAGVEIASRATAASGIPTSFLLSSTGMYGGVGWISAADTLKELEEGDRATNADPDFVAYVDAASVNFLPGITTQAIWQKIH